MTLTGTGGVGKTRLALTAGGAAPRALPGWGLVRRAGQRGGWSPGRAGGRLRAGPPRGGVPAPARDPRRRARLAEGPPDPRQLRAPRRGLRGARRDAAAGLPAAPGPRHQPRAAQHRRGEHLPGAAAGPPRRARASARGRGEIRGRSSLRRARPAGDAGLRPDPRERAGRRRGVPAPRRPAAGHRAGRGSRAAPAGRADRGAAERPIPPADGREPDDPSSPADVAGRAGLES